ncbi:DUF3460 family protein [Paracandidimonas soli]|uniref:DUF3460 family protein n=1 Tax=Paracandidimonas soli TaxID=1917182 RepID=UPI0033404317
MAKNYESEVTQFLKQLKEKDPTLDSRQLAGRARLWDKALDSELQEGYRAAKVPQQPYVYYQNTQA